MPSTPRSRPSLPQNDPPALQQKRREQLASAASLYRWVDNNENLPGVPLAASVPRDDRPTIAWLLDVAEVALEIATNQLLVKISGGERTLAKSGFPVLQAHLNEIRQSIANIRSEHQTPGDSVLRVVAHVAAALAGMHRIRLSAKIDTLKALVETNYLDAIVDRDLAQYRKLFVSLPLPAIADEFMSNETFARLRVAGPNCMLLQGIEAIPAKFPISDEQYRQVMGAQDDLHSALTERRIYLLDYAELEALVPGDTEGTPKFITAPLALFAVPRGGESLQPVAIQLGQNPARFPIFLRADSASAANAWNWQMARTFVQAADGNYHELFAHLARTHLVIEAFAVATHRTLAAEHPLNVLLMPHFEGTLFINNQAAGSLIAKDGPIDKIFAGTITSTQRSAVADRLAFDFYAKMLPADISRRAVDDVAALPDYPYRDDALLVWDALHEWVSDYINVYYSSDTDVRDDGELAAWVDEVAQQGRIKGFKAIVDKGQLIEVITMIIFTASAQHAAVNFPQRTLMVYAPAISGAAWAAPPSPETAASESDWLTLMPPIPEAQMQLNTLWLLGSVRYRPLGDYRVNHWPYLEWFDDPRITARGGPLQRFRAALSVIDGQIDQRNRERAVVYDYLKPSSIPTSINI